MMSSDLTLLQTVPVFQLFPQLVDRLKDVRAEKCNELAHPRMNRRVSVDLGGGFMDRGTRMAKPTRVISESGFASFLVRVRAKTTENKTEKNHYARLETSYFSVRHVHRKG
jgi:hypothetical protein